MTSPTGGCPESPNPNSPSALARARVVIKGSRPNPGLPGTPIPEGTLPPLLGSRETWELPWPQQWGKKKAQVRKSFSAHSDHAWKGV